MKKIFLSIACLALSAGSFGQVSEFVEASDTSAAEPTVGISVGTLDAHSLSYQEVDSIFGYGYNNLVMAQGPDSSYIGFSLHEPSYYANYGGRWNSLNSDSLYLASDSVASVRMIKGSAGYCTIPDSIRMNNRTYPVAILDAGGTRYYTSLTFLTIPSTVRGIYNGSSFTRCVYMLGSVPVLNANWGQDISVYVCNQDDYAGYTASSQFKSSTLRPYGWEFEWITVDVSSPGAFADNYLTANDNDWSKGINVKITGELNAVDMNNISKLSSLQKLDLSEATGLTEVPENFMYERKSLLEVKLPESITTIGWQAFWHCKNLASINLGSVRNIVESAFSGCTALSEVDLSSLTSAGSYFLTDCTGLQTVELPKVKKLGRCAFAQCYNLKEIILSDSLTSIGDRAMSECTSLARIEIPASVQTLPDNIFYGCTALHTVMLPNTLTSIEGAAFYGCTSLRKIVLPSTLRRIGYSVFCNDTALDTVVCKAVVPPSADGNFVGGDNMDMTQVTLCVPAFSLESYYRNQEYWSDFMHMRPMDESIDYIYVDAPLALDVQDEYNGIAAVELGCNNSYAQLTLSGSGALSTDILKIDGGGYRSYYNGEIPSLIVEGEVAVKTDSIAHTMHLLSSGYYYGDAGWSFISLPYDVKVSDIVPSENTYWTIRRYDGAKRAAGDTAWIDLKADDELKAYQGYIVSVWNNNNSEGILTFTSGAGKVGSLNTIFRSDDVTLPLEENAAEFAHNRSWNLIGNPYPSYFDLHALDGFTAPITVYGENNRDAYTAYSPIDDDYVLRPYQAFFVQRPVEQESITFKAEGRVHTNAVARQAYAPAIAQNQVVANDRHVFNFNLSSDGQSADRARIVLNPAASCDYELDRDAAKFFAEQPGVEIYVKGEKALYAIDERPVADGKALLGLRTAKDGVYTLSLNGKYDSEWTVILTDLKNGTRTDLTVHDYTFTADAGDNASRFSVEFTRSTEGDDESAGIDEIEMEWNADAHVTVTAANGAVVYEGTLGNITVPTAGVYIVTSGNNSRKVTLK